MTFLLTYLSGDRQRIHTIPLAVPDIADVHHTADSQQFKDQHLGRGAVWNLVAITLEDAVAEVVAALGDAL